MLTDTPRPDCPDCNGTGGWWEDYGDHYGEYAGSEWWPCDCWHPGWRWTVLPLPKRPPADGYFSKEPPF